MRQIKINDITHSQLLDIHRRCDLDFSPPLSSMVEIDRFVDKIVRLARIISIEVDGELAGILSIYCNDHATQRAFIPSVCIYPHFRGLGLGLMLIDQAKQLASEAGMNRIVLEVGKDNRAALNLYDKHGFLPVDESELTYFLEYDLNDMTRIPASRHSR